MTRESFIATSAACILAEYLPKSPDIGTEMPITRAIELADMLEQNGLAPWLSAPAPEPAPPKPAGWAAECPRCGSKRIALTCLECAPASEPALTAKEAICSSVNPFDGRFCEFPMGHSGLHGYPIGDGLHTTWYKPAPAPSPLNDFGAPVRSPAKSCSLTIHLPGITYGCTREPGHSGPHHNHFGPHTWPQPPAPAPAPPPAPSEGEGEEATRLNNIWNDAAAAYLLAYPLEDGANLLDQGLRDTKAHKAGAVALAAHVRRESAAEVERKLDYVRTAADDEVRSITAKLHASEAEAARLRTSLHTASEAVREWQRLAFMDQAALSAAEKELTQLREQLASRPPLPPPPSLERLAALHIIAEKAELWGLLMRWKLDREADGMALDPITKAQLRDRSVALLAALDDYAAFTRPAPPPAQKPHKPGCLLSHIQHAGTCLLPGDIVPASGEAAAPPERSAPE